MFERCRGIALETVDGGLLEDVSISNVTMRDITNSPIFMRIGSRMRGPEGVPPGSIRRISIDNLTVYNADPEYSSIIAGIPGHPVEDIRLSNIHIHTQGGGTAEQAARILPENEKSYPEPSMFGVTPSYGFFIRHAKGVRMNQVTLRFETNDLRPAFVIEKASDLVLSNIDAQRAEGADVCVLREVERFRSLQCEGLDNRQFKESSAESF